MPDLISFPAELLLHIFDDLYSHRPRQFWPHVPLTAVIESDCEHSTAYQTLATLARTCRTLHPIATEALYKRSISSFQRQQEAFTHQAEPNSTARRDTRYIEILQDHEDVPTLLQEETDPTYISAAQTTGHWRKVAYERSRLEHAQTALALLVAKSPNLEIIVMKSEHRERRHEWQKSLPIWLLPIIEAMRHILVGIRTQTGYERLHTLDLSMQRTYSTDVAYIFALPRLRRLRLRDIHFLDEGFQPVYWPLLP
jgi:hypothetical protein